MIETHANPNNVSPRWHARLGRAFGAYISNPTLATYSPYGLGSMANGQIAAALMHRRGVVGGHTDHPAGEFCEYVLCPQAWL